MASLTRRFALAATALAFLLLVMPALASAAITVTNTNDTGAGSLRAAITTANGSPTVATTINFSVSGTITLGSALPAIANSSPNGSLTIDGSGQAITVYGVSSYQIFSVNSGATLSLRNLTINDGLATDGGGADNAGILTVTNSTFSNNSTGGGEGGGIYSDTMLTVTNSTFSDNSATGGLGGGISNDGGTMTVTNSTFSNNSTGGGEGGGIYSDTMLTVTNSTFSGNSATGGLGGGGIFNAGGATLKGNVLAGESGGNCGFSSPTDAGYNISDDTTCGFGSATSINGSKTLNLDPMGLQNNGGPTQTVALEPNSQAVGFIPVANCTDQSSPSPQPLTTDQRGLPRPDPNNPNFCDAGAYELQTATFTVTNTNDSGTGSLRAAIASASAVPTLASTINFSVSGTITLASPLPAIAIPRPGSLTIDGSGQSGAVDGANTFQIFGVNTGVTLILRNLRIQNGSSTGGGGGVNSTGTLTVTNCAFSGNAANSGGGIASSGMLTVTNSTFSGNSASDGDGVDNLNGSVTLKGTILANESSGNCIFTINDAGYNISDDNTCGFSGTSINNSTTLKLDPAGLQKNGGPTQTIALEANSQAIDFIPVAVAPTSHRRRRKL